VPIEASTRKASVRVSSRHLIFILGLLIIFIVGFIIYRIPTKKQTSSSSGESWWALFHIEPTISNLTCSAWDSYLEVSDHPAEISVLRQWALKVKVDEEEHCLPFANGTGLNNSNDSISYRKRRKQVID